MRRGGGSGDSVAADPPHSPPLPPLCLQAILVDRAKEKEQRSFLNAVSAIGRGGCTVHVHVHVHVGSASASVG